MSRCNINSILPSHLNAWRRPISILIIIIYHLHNRHILSSSFRLNTQKGPRPRIHQMKVYIPVYTNTSFHHKHLGDMQRSVPYCYTNWSPYSMFLKLIKQNKPMRIVFFHIQFDWLRKLWRCVLLEKANFIINCFVSVCVF